MTSTVTPKTEPTPKEPEAAAAAILWKEPPRPPLIRKPFGATPPI